MLHEELRRLKSRAEERRRDSIESRLEALSKFERMLNEHTPQLLEAVHRDFAKPHDETLLTEIYPTLKGIKTARKRLRRWARPRKVATPLSLWGSKSWIQPEARGLSLILSPWNYPVNLSLGPLTSAIAAGCTVILKPSELTPHTSSALRALIEGTFAPDHVRVVEGGIEASTNLLDFPFDHIFFTGSPQVGSIVMEKAARHLTSVTLELGGKSPVIVDATADLQTAARAVAWGKFINSGQTCIAPDYVLIEQSVLEPFREALLSAWQEMEGSGQERPQIVNERHAQRLEQWRRQASEQGAKVLSPPAPDMADLRRMPMSVIENAPKETHVRQQEIFGPLLPLRTFQNFADLMASVNESPRPLALYVFSRSREMIDRCLREIPAGGVCINETLMHFVNENLPFGGLNSSGFGASHGEHGFNAFSHQKAVLERRHSSWIGRILHPPYGPRQRRMLRLLLDWL